MSQWSQAYLARYEENLAYTELQTEHARFVVESVAKASGLPILLPVTARTKSVASLRAKLRRHAPRKKLYDRIGVRVVCYYVSDVDALIKAFKRALDWDVGLSSDRRVMLGTTQFGYRSVHLVVRVRDSSLGLAAFGALEAEWFELQVRTVLEHAWAEIEHKVRYKARLKYPDATERTINAVAGTLELLDAQFAELRTAPARVVAVHRLSYESGQDLDEPFDAARLMAYFEATRPAGLSWTDAAQSGKPFLLHSESVCLEALASSGIVTAALASKAIRSRSLVNDLLAYASATGLAVDSISHPAVAVLLAASADADLVLGSFSELLSDEPLTRLVTRRASLAGQARARGRATK